MKRDGRRLYCEMAKIRIQQLLEKGMKKTTNSRDSTNVTTSRTDDDGTGRQRRINYGQGIGNHMKEARDGR
jgi:hypothetical protein